MFPATKLIMIQTPLHKLSTSLKLKGVAVVQAFNEFSLELPSDASIFVDYASKKGVLAGLPADRLFHLDGRYKNILVLAVTELNTKTDMNALIKIFKDYFK